ncbi:MAG TPA: class I SAM-dependent methyltransferase [Bryobacteraceae bacterium]|nr:class I SAM-dependent methyltransferase [Bryobacteraceae bacterium]
MAIDSGITAKMREDWNARAQEDANFYVAFGRRGQDTGEFFETGDEIVHGLEWEMKRMPANANRRAWRALEIGCGPGRLLKPMSRHFGEIHGIDVSDEMIQRARVNLAGISHAHEHHTTGADLAPFADESFDFVYSYAVFQHIPSEEVVLNYLREAQRVMKPGAILRAQINGLPETATHYDTWSGVRISAQKVADFARAHDFQLLALEGISTQYMWTTWCKRRPGWWEGEPDGATRIRRVTNAHSSEPVAPTRGRFASITIWLENLPPNADLNHLEVFVNGEKGFPCYIGPREADGLQQLNVMLPPLQTTGLLAIGLQWNGRLLCAPGRIRVIPPGPEVPRILSVTDGINMLSGIRIVSGSIKVTIEEVRSPETLFAAKIDGQPVRNIDVFCADPLPPRYEINFDLPQHISPGSHQISMSLGSRRFAPVEIQVL